MKEIFVRLINASADDEHKRLYDYAYRRLIADYRHVDDIIGGEHTDVLIGAVETVLRKQKMTAEQRKTILWSADRYIVDMQDELATLKKRGAYLYEYDDCISYHTRLLCAALVEYVWPKDKGPIRKNELKPDR